MQGRRGHRWVDGYGAEYDKDDTLEVVAPWRLRVLVERFNVR